MILRDDYRIIQREMVTILSSADGNYEVRYKCNVLIYNTGLVMWVTPAIYQVIVDGNESNQSNARRSIIRIKTHLPLLENVGYMSNRARAPSTSHTSRSTSRPACLNSDRGLSTATKCRWASIWTRSMSTCPITGNRALGTSSKYQVRRNNNNNNNQWFAFANTKQIKCN